MQYCGPALAQGVDIVNKFSFWLRFMKWFFKAVAVRLVTRYSQAFSLKGSYGRGSGQEPLHILIVGGESTAGDANQIFFQGAGVIQKLGPVSRLFPDRSWKRYADLQPDFVLNELPPWQRKLAPSALGLQTELDAVYYNVRGDLDVFVANHYNSGLRNNLRRARAENFTIEFTERVEDLITFYNDYFAPMAEARHGEQAYVPPLSYFLARQKNLVVAYLSKNEQRLAGHLYLRSRLDRTLRVWKMGARTDVYSDRKALGTVNIALSYRALEYAIAHGYTTVSLGVMLPVISNGIFSNKARMGVKSQCLPDFPLCRLEILNSTKADVFDQRPLAVIRNHKIVGLFYNQNPDKDSQTLVRELTRKYTLTSLDGLALMEGSGAIRELPWEIESKGQSADTSEADSA